MTLPKQYQWLATNTTALVQAALKDLGTLEGPGTANNPRIINWADEVAAANPTPYNNWAADWYNKDSVPWCGLAMAVWAVRSANGKADRMPPKNYLAAASWASWGVPVQFRGREGLRLNEILLGDVAVFSRSGGNHVAIILGVTHDGKWLLCLGGNQDDAVNIKRFAISRLYAVRRPPYKVRPQGARHVRVASTGAISTREG